MNLTLSQVAILFVVGLIVYGWWHNMGIKDWAMKAVKEGCQNRDVQFLDESLMLKRIWFAKARHGQPNLKRVYEFEFTATGNDRFTGRIELIGRDVMDFELSAHSI